MSHPRSRRERWVALPNARRRRFVLPATNRRLAWSGLSVYQPVTGRALLGWTIARLAARLGLFRFLPDAEPPTEPHGICEPFPDAVMAVARSGRPTRSTILLLKPSGATMAIAKVAEDELGARRLRHEATWLQRFGPQLAPPLSAPVLLEHRPGALSFRAVAWRPRLRAWELEPAVAAAMGDFYRRAGGNEMSGPAHGDFAPWNLLRVQDGWVLIDWEEATDDGAPFQDPFHWLVQSHALLRRPSQRTLLRGLRGHGRIGQALEAYAASAGLEGIDRVGSFRAYLEHTIAMADPADQARRAEIEARVRLLESLDAEVSGTATEVAP